MAFLLPILVYDRSWIRSRKGVSSLYIDCILRWPLGGPPGDLNDGAIGLGYRFRKFSFPPGEKPYLLLPSPAANRMAFDAYIERLHVLHKLTRTLELRAPTPLRVCLV